MMSKKYYIYHIPDYVHSDGSVGKIGVTVNPIRRIVREQSSDLYEILEEHDDIYEVSKREIKLQKQYGYKVDDCPYFSTILKFQSKGSKLGNTKKARKKALVKQKNTIAKKGLNKKEKNPRAKITQEIADKIRNIYESGKITNKAELGRMFGVSDSMIRYIVQYKNWN